MKIDKEHIVSYIPQRAPFIMIDNLIDAADGAFMTDFHVLPDNIFLEGDTLREFALIENIAQSSAAGISFMKSTSQSGSSDGFIGGISKLIVHALPKVNDTIRTVVTQLLQFENMYLLKGECYVDGRKMLECEIKLAGK